MIFGKFLNKHTSEPILLSEPTLSFEKKRVFLNEPTIFFQSYPIFLLPYVPHQETIPMVVPPPPTLSLVVAPFSLPSLFLAGISD